MPIYEFWCNVCQQKSSLFVRGINTPQPPVCSACGSSKLTRLVSTFAHHKSEKSRLKEAGEPTISPHPDYYKDPRNIGRWAEKRLEELGIDMHSEGYKDTFAGVREEIAKAREGDMSILEKKGL